jgi:hypothetical protein
MQSVTSTLCGCGNCEAAWFEQGWKCSKAIDINSGKDIAVEGEGRPVGMAERIGDAMNVLVPQHVVGSLLGNRGKRVQWLQEETKCRIQVDNQSDNDGNVKTARMVKIRSSSTSPPEREIALELCAYVMETLCVEQDSSLEQVLINGRNQLRVREEAMLLEEQKQREAQVAEENQGAVRQLMRRVGDLFSESAIREALTKEEWDLDQAEERLFQEGNSVPTIAPVSAAVSTPSPATRHTVSDCVPEPPPRKEEPQVSKAVMMIRAVCEKARAKAESQPNVRQLKQHASQQACNRQQGEFTRQVSDRCQPAAVRANRFTAARRC